MGQGGSKDTQGAGRLERAPRIGNEIRMNHCHPGRLCHLVEPPVRSAEARLEVRDDPGEEGEEDDARLLQLGEGSVEFPVVHQEGVVLRTDILGIDEIESDAVAGLHRPERTPLWAGLYAKDIGKEARRRVLVSGGDDDVIEGWHVLSGGFPLK